MASIKGYYYVRSVTAETKEHSLVPPIATIELPREKTWPNVIMIYPKMENVTYPVAFSVRLFYGDAYAGRTVHTKVSATVEYPAPAGPGHYADIVATFENSYVVYVAVNKSEEDAIRQLRSVCTLSPKESFGETIRGVLAFVSVLSIIATVSLFVAVLVRLNRHSRRLNL